MTATGVDYSYGAKHNCNAANPISGRRVCRVWSDPLLPFAQSFNRGVVQPLWRSRAEKALSFFCSRRYRMAVVYNVTNWSAIVDTHIFQHCTMVQRRRLTLRSLYVTLHGRRATMWNLFSPIVLPLATCGSGAVLSLCTSFHTCDNTAPPNCLKYPKRAQQGHRRNIFAQNTLSVSMCCEYKSIAHACINWTFHRRS